MKLSALVEGLEHRRLGPDVEIESLAYDSRRVTTGSLFAALVGAASDGHNYVEQAVARGAVAILSERPASVGSATEIRVQNTRHTLAQMARRFYAAPDEDLLLVGITGTNGKTTVSHIAAQVLGAPERRVAILGTLGLKIDEKVRETGLTTPESVDLVGMLAQLREQGVEGLVMEVSSHALDQSRVDGVSFDVAVFTNLSRDHLDYHGTMERYFKAKARLFRDLLRSEGVAVVNLDDAHGRSLANESSAPWTFGIESPDARVRAVEFECRADGTDGVVQIEDQSFAFRSPLLGRFNLSNVLAALALGAGLQRPPQTLVDRLSGLRAIPGRLERVSGPGQPLVVVDYAHTPDALSQVLGVVGRLGSGSLGCVIGCGGDRDQGKRYAMGKVAAAGADWTLITNDNPRSEDPMVIAEAIAQGLVDGGARAGIDYEVILDRDVAIERAIRRCDVQDSVVIAGKGHEDYQIIGEEARPFDDRVVARDVLESLGGD